MKRPLLLALMFCAVSLLLTGCAALLVGAAAGAGGVAYVLDSDGTFASRCNRGMVELEKPDDEDLATLHDLVRRHFDYTQSSVAWRLLSGWKQLSSAFVKVMPTEYRKVLEKNRRQTA